MEIGIEKKIAEPDGIFGKFSKKLKYFPQLDS